MARSRWPASAASALIVTLAITADADDAAASYDSRTLLLRLRRLEAENAALEAEVGDLTRAMPNCTSFVQTGGCDPEGVIEQRKRCDETIEGGASGYCECRHGAKAARVSCSHAPFRCDEVCNDLTVGGATIRAAISQATGQAVALSTSASGGSTDCHSLRGCRSCASVDGCGWCLQTRRCVGDDPWICQVCISPRSHTRSPRSHTLSPRSHTLPTISHHLLTISTHLRWTSHHLLTISHVPG